MDKERLKQIIETSAGVAALWVIWQMIRGCFTPLQKEWFRERDSHMCQFPVEDERGELIPCGSKKGLQIHHILPQRWGKDHGYTDDQIDSPRNGLTLCEDHHQKYVHNDMLLARLAYRHNKDSFKNAFNRRNALVEQGKKYWVDDKDELFKARAAHNTERFKKPFPEKRNRSTVGR